MKSCDTQKVSSRYDARELDTSYIETVYNLFTTNPQYSEYCGASVDRDMIAEDIAKRPKKLNKNDKHYLGFFDGGNLIAVMDFLMRYPDSESAWIGFFMVDGNQSRTGIGTSIINEFINYVVTLGIKRIGLGFEISNPQSSYFWKKNGFETEKIVDSPSGRIAVAYKRL